MSEVFLCATGQLDARSKRDLRKAGVVVVEVEDPSTCQFIRAEEVVSSSDMVWAALEAIQSDTSYSSRAVKNRLVGNLLKVVVAARQKASV